MSKEEIEQRIKYLVEHGGIWEDPTDEIRRMVSVNRILAGLLVVLVLGNLAVQVMLH